MMQALCIGGPKDGKLHPVQGTSFTIHERTNLTMLRYDYKMELFHTPTKKFYFWVLEGTTPEQLVDALITAYQHPR